MDKGTTVKEDLISYLDPALLPPSEVQAAGVNDEKPIINTNERSSLLLNKSELDLEALGRTTQGIEIITSPNSNNNNNSRHSSRGNSPRSNSLKKIPKRTTSMIQLDEETIEPSVSNEEAQIMLHNDENEESDT